MLSRRKFLNTLFGGAAGAMAGLTAFKLGEDKSTMGEEGIFRSSEMQPIAHENTGHTLSRLRQRLALYHPDIDHEKLDRVAEDYDRDYNAIICGLAGASGFATLTIMQSQYMQGLLEEGEVQAYFAPLLSNGFFFGEGGSFLTTGYPLLAEPAVLAENYGLDDVQAVNIQYTLASYIHEDEVMKAVVTSTIASSALYEGLRRRPDAKAAIEKDIKSEPLQPRGPWE